MAKTLSLKHGITLSLLASLISCGAGAAHSTKRTCYAETKGNASAVWHPLHGGRTQTVLLHAELIDGETQRAAVVGELKPAAQVKYIEFNLEDIHGKRPVLRVEYSTAKDHTVRYLTRELSKSGSVSVWLQNEDGQSPFVHRFAVVAVPHKDDDIAEASVWNVTVDGQSFGQNLDTANGDHDELLNVN